MGREATIVDFRPRWADALESASARKLQVSIVCTSGAEYTGIPTDYGDDIYLTQVSQKSIHIDKNSIKHIHITHHD